jgi:hypothetical protein
VRNEFIKTKDYFGGLEFGLDEKVILKRNVQKYGVMIWTGFS